MNTREFINGTLFTPIEIRILEIPHFNLEPCLVHSKLQLPDNIIFNVFISLGRHNYSFPSLTHSVGTDYSYSSTNQAVGTQYLITGGMFYLPWFVKKYFFSPNHPLILGDFSSNFKKCYFSLP